MKLNRLLLWGVGLSLCINPPAFATSTLNVYTLTAAEKEQFSTTDGVVSGFWTTDWQGRDSILMTPANNTDPDGTSFDGPMDAQIVVKAAADGSGLYFCMVVEDDIFVDGTTWDMDYTDFCFDTLSTADIIAGGQAISGNVTGEYPFSFTLSGQQFQVPMGGTQAPTSLFYNYFDTVPRGIPGFNMMYTTVDFDKLPQQCAGTSVEICTIDKTHKAEEFFLSWDFLGQSGLPSGTVLAGRHFALSGGYNDQDNPGATSDAVKRLRWNLWDPFPKLWAHSQASWGDLVLASDMPSVHATTRVKMNSGNMLKNRGTVMKTEFFSLLGQKINSVRVNTVSNPIVQRSIFSNGNSATGIICK